jgi:hypothetical protein
VPSCLLASVDFERLVIRDGDRVAVAAVWYETAGATGSSRACRSSRLAVWSAQSVLRGGWLSVLLAPTSTWW